MEQRSTHVAQPAPPFSWQQLCDFGALPDWNEVDVERRSPLGAVDRPEMMPPKLDVHQTAPAGAPAHWWKPAIDLLGFKAHWFNTGEVTLYLVAGPRNGRTPLLLLPGQVEPWHSYLPSLGELQDKFEVTVMELRGHGYSERAHPNTYRVIDYARDTEAVIRHFIGEKTLVSGNSLGGVVVIAMGQLCPELMSGAFIEDAPYTIVGEPDWMTGPIQNALFYPDQVVARGVQEGGMSVMEATRIYAEAPMIALNPEEYGKDRRRQFADLVLDLKLKPILEHLPDHLANRYRAAWERYVETGKIGRKIDHAPFVALDLSTHALIKTDWNAPNTMVRGKWMEGFDEDTALRGLTMPTLFWESDLIFYPHHNEVQRAHTLSVISEPDRRFEHFYAEGCPHISHKERPDVYLPKIISFFGDIERQPFG